MGREYGKRHCGRCGRETSTNAETARNGKPVYCKDCRHADFGLIKKWEKEDA